MAAVSYHGTVFLPLGQTKLLSMPRASGTYPLVCVKKIVNLCHDKSYNGYQKHLFDEVIYHMERHVDNSV